MSIYRLAQRLCGYNNQAYYEILWFTIFDGFLYKSKYVLEFSPNLLSTYFPRVYVRIIFVDSLKISTVQIFVTVNS